jgi:membrane associated rhomboid family serine protease
MTPWVGRLIMANVLVLLLVMGAPGPLSQFALVPALLLTQPWRAFTYMFLHAGFTHLFFNMLSLYFFGPQLELRLGGRRFIGLYLASGLGGAVLSLLTPFVPIVGASGAVFGVMLGYARYWPRAKVYLYGVFGVEARWLIVFMVAGGLWGGFGGVQSGIAHFAHLGGFAGGYLYLKWAEIRSPAAQFRAMAGSAPGRVSAAQTERWARIRPETLHAVNREEYERVAAKLAEHGVTGLSADERAFLDRFSPQT